MLGGGVHHGGQQHRHVAQHQAAVIHGLRQFSQGGVRRLPIERFADLGASVDDYFFDGGARRLTGPNHRQRREAAHARHGEVHQPLRAKQGPAYAQARRPAVHDVGELCDVHPPAGDGRGHVQRRGGVQVDAVAHHPRQFGDFQKQSVAVRDERCGIALRHLKRGRPAGDQGFGLQGNIGAGWDLQVDAQVALRARNERSSASKHHAAAKGNQVALADGQGGHDRYGQLHPGGIGGQRVALGGGAQVWIEASLAGVF